MRYTSEHQVKPICVRLAAQKPLQEDSRDTVLSLLTTLHAALQQPDVAHELAVKPSFAAYTLFPFTRLLQLNSFDLFQRHPAVLSRLLQALVAWLTPQQAQHAAAPASPVLQDTLSQLWLVCALILGGPLENPPPVYPWPEDVRFHALELLFLILDQPGPPQQQQNTLLAHTMTALLSPALGFSPACRTKALQTLALLYLKHPQFTQDGLDVQFLPGLVSSLIKILLPQSSPSATASAASSRSSSTKPLPSPVAVEALSLLTKALLQVAGNQACEGLLRQQPKIDRLEDLAGLDVLQEQPDEPLLSSTTKDDGDNSKLPTQRTRSWLDTTAQQVHWAVLSLLPTYRQIDHPDVRVAFANFAASLLTQADATLHEETVRLLRMEVCALAVDPWPQVQQAAVKGARGTLKDVQQYQDILSQALLRLSSDIQRHGDDPTKLAWSLRVLQGAASILLKLLSTSQSPHLPIRAASLASETWALSLLRAVEFARLPGLHDPVGQDKAARAWIAPPPTLLSADNDPSDAKDPARLRFPVLGMKNVPSASAQLHLEQAIQLLGQLYIRIGLSSILEQFLDLATGGLAPELKASAWWIVSLLTACLHQDAEQSKLVRRVVQAASEFEESDGAVATTSQRPAAEEDSGVLVERVKGLQVETLLSDYKVDSEGFRAEAAARSRKSARLVAHCMSLRALAACSKVMETDFRAQLLFCLYPVLAQLGTTTHPLVREHAEMALQHMAFHSGYASTVNLVLDNVDYIINAVSQRLLLTQLDPRAPQVLIAVIRLVGEPVVPLLTDIVDDVFDALDNFHGYTTLCASLLAVLDSLVKSIARSETGQRRAKPPPFYQPPNPQSDLERFAVWLKESQRASDPEEEEADPFHGQPSAEAFRHASEQLKSEAPRNDEQPNPPTKAQKTCSLILRKSLHFLSHSSAFLRARVLALVASTVNVLGAQSRESEMLPFVNKAWPIILNRLGRQEELFVVAEAASLVKELAAQVGDYACRKILDDAWPRFQALLQHQAATQPKPSRSSAQGAHTSAHRLRVAVFETMQLVAEEVPLRDGMDWDLATALRDVLLASQDGHLEAAATGFFRSLSEVAPEGVWVALHGAVGDVGGMPGFMLGSRGTESVSNVLARMNEI